MSKQTLSFQAEVAQLLHLVTHSLYSNQEIFLRELISNASDACDKLRFEGLNNAALFEDAPNLEVRVTFDKAAKTLTITDNGIGMSQQEAIDHLGTIAKSGTKDFMGRLSGDQKADAQLIGQFGVGFYSGFIVADRITVMVDGGVLVKLLPEINAAFGLTPQQVERLSPNRQVVVYKAMSAAGGMVIGRVITREVVMQLLKLVGVRLTTQQAAKFVPVAGQAVSALLDDLAVRGLLESTLVVVVGRRGQFLGP